MGKKSKKTDAMNANRKTTVSDVAPSRLMPHVSRLASHASRLTFLTDSRFHIACLVFLIILIYSNTLNAPFQWDESKHLVDNPIVKDLRYILHPSEGQWSEQYEFFVSRYIAFLTFALNYRIHGLSVTGYHIVNIAIHIANSILVYLLVLLTFRTPFFRGQGLGISGQESEKGSQRQSLVPGTRSLTPKLVAFFSAALFAVHPLQTEAVTYVMQRFASLVAFFYLLSIVAYIKFRLCTPMSLRAPDGGAAISSFKARLLHLVRNDTSYSRRIFFYSVAVISAVLAMKTKENAFTLPIVIALYEFCFFSVPSPHVPVSPRPRVPASSLPSPRVPASPRLRVLHSPRLHYLVPILLTLLIIPLTHMSLGASPQIDPGLYGHIYPQPEYLFTEFRVIVTYLRLLFLPINQNLDYDYHVFHSFFAPQVIASFLFLSALFGLGVYMIIGNRQWAIGNGIKAKDKEDDSRFTNSRCFGSTIHDSRPFRLVGFGILWFFITISVESSVVPLWLLICEYRVYLPSVGISIAVVTGVFWFFSRFASHISRRLILVLFLAVGVLAVATYLRNEVWGDSLRLWEDTVRKSPAKASVHDFLGYHYQQNNLLDKAMEQYLIAVKLDPDDAALHNDLGGAYESFHMPDKAVEQYMIAVKLDPDLAEAHYNLGLAYKSLNMPDKAMEQYLIAIKLRPDYAEAHHNLGNIYLSLNMPDKAMEQYLIAVKLRPDYADPHTNLGIIYNSLNMPDKALHELQIVANLKPDVAESHFNLGILYYKMGQTEKARQEITAGLKIKPDVQWAQQFLKGIPSH